MYFILITVLQKLPSHCRAELHRVSSPTNSSNTAACRANGRRVGEREGGGEREGEGEGEGEVEGEGGEGEGKGEGRGRGKGRGRGRGRERWERES